MAYKLVWSPNALDDLHNIVHVLHSLRKQGKVDFTERDKGEPTNIRLAKAKSKTPVAGVAPPTREETIEVVEPMRDLKVEASRVFDIIEDHTDFGRAILAVLADGLLATPRMEA